MYSISRQWKHNRLKKFNSRIVFMSTIPTKNEDISKKKMKIRQLSIGPISKTLEFWDRVYSDLEKLFLRTWQGY